MVSSYFELGWIDWGPLVSQRMTTWMMKQAKCKGRTQHAEQVKESLQAHMASPSAMQSMKALRSTRRRACCMWH